MLLFSILLLIAIVVLFTKVSDLTARVKHLSGLSKHLQKELNALKEAAQSSTHKEVNNPTVEATQAVNVEKTVEPLVTPTVQDIEPISDKFATPETLVKPSAASNTTQSFDSAIEQIEQLVNVSPWSEPIKQAISALNGAQVTPEHSIDSKAETASKDELNSKNQSNSTTSSQEQATKLPLQKDKEASFSIFAMFAKNWIPISGAAFIFVGLAYALIAANVSVAFFVGLAYLAFTLLFGASVSQHALDFVFKSHSKDDAVQSSAQISAGVSVGLLYLTTFIANTVLDLFSMNTAFMLYFLTSAALFKVSIFSDKPAKALTAIGFIGAYLSPILTFKVSGAWSSSLAFNLVYAYMLLVFSLYVSLRNRWVEISLLSQTMAGILAGNALIFAHYMGAPLLVKEFGVLLVVATLLAWLIKYTKNNTILAIDKVATYYTTTVCVILSLVATGLVIGHPVERILGGIATILIFGASVWATKTSKWLNDVLKASSAIAFVGLVALNNSFMPSELGFVLIFLEGLLLLKIAEPTSFLRTKLIWPLCTVPLVSLLAFASPLTAFVMFALVSSLLFVSDRFKLELGLVFKLIFAVVSFLFLAVLFIGLHASSTILMTALILWSLVLHASDRVIQRDKLQAYVHMALFWLMTFLPLILQAHNMSGLKIAIILALQYGVLLAYYKWYKFIFSSYVFLGIFTASLICYGVLQTDCIYLLIVMMAFLVSSLFFFERPNLIMLDSNKVPQEVTTVNMFSRAVVFLCAVGAVVPFFDPMHHAAYSFIIFVVGAINLYYETFKIQNKPWYTSLNVKAFKLHIIALAAISWLAVFTPGNSSQFINEFITLRTIFLAYTVLVTIVLCSALKTASVTKNLSAWIMVASMLGIDVLAMIALMQGLGNKLQIGIPFLIIGFALLWAGFVAPKPVSKSN